MCCIDDGTEKDKLLRDGVTEIGNHTYNAVCGPKSTWICYDDDGKWGQIGNNNCWHSGGYGEYPSNEEQTYFYRDNNVNIPYERAFDNSYVAFNKKCKKDKGIISE